MSTTFDVHFSGTYSRDEVPPRCRKPRPVIHSAEADVSVRIVDATDAPVAFRVRRFDSEPADEVRLFDGDLYGLYRPFSRQVEPSIPGDAHFPANQNIEPYLGPIHFRYVSSDEGFTQAAEDWAEEFLIIDGIVWSKTGEPCYSVYVSHGRAAVLTGTLPDYGVVFRADDFEGALAYAVHNGGDREREPRIEVLIPEAVTIVTPPVTPDEVEALRSAYSSAVYDLYNATSRKDAAESTDVLDKVVRLREEIAATGWPLFDERLTAYEGRKHPEDD